MPTPAAFAATAALLGDPARAAMLQALLSGEALTAGELARVAGIGAPAASAHLARLVEGGLVAVHPQGRHRYHRLASPPPPARPPRRFACDCMDWSERRAHLAGGLGREIAACCLRRHWVSRLSGDGEGDPLARRRLAVTPEGARR